jgi:CheY-like chemotaxis protein
MGRGRSKDVGSMQSNRVRVLVVEDDDDVAETIAEVLESKGCDTRVAHDAATALTLAVEFLPAVAFVDIGLPVMDGYELATRLRALPALAGIRLVALTGYGTASDRERARQAGFDDHVVKPVGIEALEAALS